MDDPMVGLRVDFSLPPATVRGAVSKVATSSGLPAVQPPSSNSQPTTMTKREFVKSMAELVRLKRTTEFTKPELRAWYAALRCFPWTVVNRAVIETSLSETKFPDLGDLVRACDKQLPKGYCAMGGDGPWKPSSSLVQSIAKDLGLDV